MSREALCQSTHAVSDGLSAFTEMSWADMRHEVIIVGTGRKSMQQPWLHWTNIVPDNLKPS